MTSITSTYLRRDTIHTMNGEFFDGQQEGERILFTIEPHPLIHQLALARIIVIFCIFAASLLIVASGSEATGLVYLLGFLAAAIITAAGVWWNRMYFRDTRGYVTDRRIIRFERVSPFVMTKRALFWNEALKAKAYEPNIFFKSFKLGTLTVEPQAAGGENVIIKHVYYAEDLANYIDKILFAFKNNPQDIALIRPFVPKPRGQRD